VAALYALMAAVVMAVVAPLVLLRMALLALAVARVLVGMGRRNKNALDTGNGRVVGMGVVAVWWWW
jgi:hypothetical protein